MTWFRVGGAGIPATLKNAMNAVFNKKFGTSGQNYPPKQWPDDVNLLGPLPEGTASGPVANFDDGADDVPLKSIECSIIPQGGNGTPSSPVAITGISSFNLYHGKKNLLPMVNYDMFIPTNPFSLNIDFGSYAEQEAGTLANNSFFMQGFANAMATLSESGCAYGSSEGGAGVSSASSAGCAGGSCSVGGGFTSVG